MVPGYMKDVLGYTEDPVQQATGKIATGPKLIYELLTNRDYRGLPIAERSEMAQGQGAPGWFQAYLQHIAEAFVPITIKGMQPKTGSALSLPEKALGIRPAPKYLGEPDVYREQVERQRSQLDKRKERSDERLRQQQAP